MSYSTIYKTFLLTNNVRKAHFPFVVDLQLLYDFDWQFLSSWSHVVASRNQLSWVYLGFVSGKLWQSSQSSHKQVDVWNQSKSCIKIKGGRTWGVQSFLWKPFLLIVFFPYFFIPFIFKLNTFFKAQEPEFTIYF